MIFYNTGYRDIGTTAVVTTTVNSVYTYSSVYAPGDAIGTYSRSYSDSAGGYTNEFQAGAGFTYLAQAGLEADDARDANIINRWQAYPWNYYSVYAGRRGPMYMLPPNIHSDNTGVYVAVSHNVPGHTIPFYNHKSGVTDSGQIVVAMGSSSFQKQAWPMPLTAR